MKALLINPYVPLEVVYGAKSSDLGAVLPPLGILYIASHIAQTGKPWTVDVLDANALCLDADDIVRRVIAGNYDIAGFSATTLGYPYAREDARAIRKAVPEVTLAIGGAHAQGAAKDIVLEADNVFDYVCYHEGEIAFEDLLTYIDSGKNASFPRGFMCMREGEVFTSPPPPIPDNLDVFGHPARLIGEETIGLYHEKIFAYKRLPLFSVMSSRGCPFQCTFCSTPRKFKSLYNNRMRYHSVEWVMEELKILTEKFGVREVIFVDDTFNVRKERVLEISQRLTDSGMDLIWSCNYEANIGDLAMMRAMKQAGCWSIMIGGESGSDRILELIRKGVTKTQLGAVADWANSAGIVSRVSFILGLPGDTEDTIRETIDFVKSSPFHFPYFQLYVPIPGTVMYDHLSEYGKIIALDSSKLSASNVNYLPHDISEMFLRKSFKNSLKECYLRWNTVKNHIQFIRSFEDVIRYWKGFMALVKAG